VVVEVAWASLGPLLLSKSRSDPRGSNEAESLPARLGEAGPAHEGSGDTEPMPEGSDEPKTVLDGLRPMSFNPCPTGTIILVPDTTQTLVLRVP
jgi:hypothetical protein